ESRHTASGVRVIYEVVEVGDDDSLLRRAELVVAEDRHVLRAGQHRRVDVAVGRVLKTRCRLAGGEGTATTAERVARRAVHPVQLTAASRVAAGAEVGHGLRVGKGRTAAERLDVGPDLARLVAGELRLLAHALGLVPGQRHPAGGDLELHRGLADADQARPAVGHALRVAA